MKKKICLALAVIALGMNVCLAAEDAKSAEKPAPAQKPEAAKEEEEQFDLLEAIGLLRGSSVVLEVGDRKITWREVHPNVSHILRSNQNDGDSSATENKLREFFQSMASRGLLLNEAEAMKITVSDEERKEYEAELEKNLEGNDMDLTKEKYLASFSRNGSSMARLSYPDALKLIKLDKIKFGDMAVTDGELAAFKSYRKTMNKTFEQENEKTRNNMRILFKLKEIFTDEGFMQLAKEVSEGKEGDNGGVIDYAFTRAELAEVNDLKSFDWNVGETTSLLETEGDLRIMRVLASVPPEKEGGAERFKVAQILHGKIPLLDTQNDKALKEEILVLKRKKAIQDYIAELQKKYKVTSKLFPKGVWEKEENEDKSANPKTEPRVVDLTKIDEDGKPAKDAKNKPDNEKGGTK